MIECSKNYNFICLNKSLIFKLTWGIKIEIPCQCCPLQSMAIKKMSNGTARFRHQCTKTAVLSCHRFLISSGTCIKKLITAVIYGFRNKLKCFMVNTSLGWEVCQGQTLQLITETVDYGRNKFYDTGPWCLKNEQHLNMDKNFDHQMSLSKSKCSYSNNCLHFLKYAVPL